MDVGINFVNFSYFKSINFKLKKLELRSLLISVNTEFGFLALLAVYDLVAAMLLGQKLALVKPYHPPKTRIRSDDPFGLEIQKCDVNIFSSSHLLMKHPGI